MRKENCSKWARAFSLVVMEGQLRSRGCRFKSQHRIPDGCFFTLFVVKRPKTKQKRGRGWSNFFLKNALHPHQTFRYLPISVIRCWNNKSPNFSNNYPIMIHKRFYLKNDVFHSSLASCQNNWATL